MAITRGGDNHPTERELTRWLWRLRDIICPRRTPPITHRNIATEPHRILRVFELVGGIRTLMCSATATTVDAAETVAPVPDASEQEQEVLEYPKENGRFPRRTICSAFYATFFLQAVTRLL